MNPNSQWVSPIAPYGEVSPFSFNNATFNPNNQLAAYQPATAYLPSTNFQIPNLGPRPTTPPPLNFQRSPSPPRLPPQRSAFQPPQRLVKPIKKRIKRFELPCCKHRKPLDNYNGFIPSSKEEQITFLEQRLDKVTRSRNGLIIASIVLAAVFLTCFISLLLLAFPPPSLMNIDFVVVSTRVDFVYSAADLGSSDNYAFKLMQTTFCSQMTGVAIGVANIRKCLVEQFLDAAPGVKATVVLTVSLDGKSVTDRAYSLGEAIVRASATDSNWIVNPNEISVRMPKLT